jgi:hypothetical protein
MKQCIDTTHYYVANDSERRDLIGAWEGAYVTEDGIDDAVLELRAMTGCKRIRPLGVAVDDLGRYQYLFAIDPREAHEFAMARYDSRYIGQFAWAREISFFNSW